MSNVHRDDRRLVNVSKSNSFETFLVPRLAASLKATNTQVNKARGKHGGRRFRCHKRRADELSPTSVNTYSKCAPTPL